MSRADAVAVAVAGVGGEGGCDLLSSRDFEIDKLSSRHVNLFPFVDNEPAREKVISLSLSLS